MKNFKSFVAEEKPNIKRKAKGEQDFVDAHEVEITDPTDQGNNSAKVTTKANSGKHKNNRTDNKQEFGEDINATILSVIRGKIEETAAASTVGGLKSGEGKIKQGSSDQSVAHSSQDPASTIGGGKGSEGKIKQGSSDENTPDTGKGEAINTIGGHKNRETKNMKQGSSDEKLPDQGGLGSREKEKNVPQGSSKEKTPDTGLPGAINTIGGHRNREAVAMKQGSSKEKIPESVQPKTYREIMREADRLDNKQAMDEDTGQADARKTTPSSKEAQQKVFDKHKERMKQLTKEKVELNDHTDNKQEFGEAVKKTYQVSGKELAAKMRQIPSLKSFADKFENKPIVTPQMVDKMLPDYISGGEITKLFKESVEESVKPDVEKAFPASGVRKHNAPKSSSTMPKDKEKAKGRPAGSLKEEETQTYMVKFEKDGKVSLKNYEAKSDLDARSKAKVDAKRMGMTVSSVRLKEEVEQIEEAQVHKIVKQKDGTHDVHVKTEFGEIKHIGTIHPPVRPNLDPSYIAKYKDGTKVATSKNIDDLAKRLSGYHGKQMREEVELDEEQLREFDLYEGYEKKVLDYLDKKGVDARFVSGKLEVNKRDIAKAKMALKNAQGFDASDLEVVAEAAYTNPRLERLTAAKKKKSLRQMKEEMGIGSINEADFSKQQTKMAHTIGKEFEKKGVGDESQGGPYAIASAMVRDKPEAAQKAYKTIQSKMKEETDAELLFNLYNDLNEENQEMFMSQLEEDADSLLQFAKNFLAD